MNRRCVSVKRKKTSIENMKRCQVHSFLRCYYAPSLIRGGIKRCFCLTSDACLSVCLPVAYIGPKSRTERPRKTKIGIEIAHVTRDSDTTFKVKGQGHQAALLSAALTRKTAAAVSVGTYSAWESTATLRLQPGLVGGARGAWASTGEERGGGILCRHAHSLLYLFLYEVPAYNLQAALFTMRVSFFLF